jgi:uncharacterized protein (DUF2141 family)
MKPSAFLLSVICLLLYSYTSAQAYNLTVNITGFRNSKGNLYITLYNKKDGYPKDHTKAFRLAYNGVVNNKCTVLFDGIPKGVYAIACYHDENNNGKLDLNFIGIPKEGTGASNNAKGFMGPPSFNDARFTVDGNTTQEIKISY